MPPFPDDAGFTNGAAETEVVSSNRPHLFAVEAWLIILNGCGELTDTHVYRQNRCIPAFQACLLLNGHIHVPFAVFSAKEFAFTQLTCQERFLLVGQLHWNPDAPRINRDSNPPFMDGISLTLHFDAVASQNHWVLFPFQSVPVLLLDSASEAFSLLLRCRVELLVASSQLTLPSIVLASDSFPLTFPV